MTDVILSTLLGLSLWLNGALLTIRVRAEQLSARIPEGWEETSDSAVLCWERASAVAGCFVGGSKHYIWTEGDIPLEVLTAFCARAKERRR